MDVKEKKNSLEQEAINSLRPELVAAGITLSDIQLIVLLKLVKKCK